MLPCLVYIAIRHEYTVLDHKVVFGDLKPTGSYRVDFCCCPVRRSPKRMMRLGRVVDVDISFSIRSTVEGVGAA